MLKYDKIDITEGIDLNKTDKSKECIFCHHWYYLNKNFTYYYYYYFFIIIFFLHNIKMSYYWCNKQEIWQKAKERYSREKPAEKSQEIVIKTCQKKKKTELKSIKRRGIKN